ncbi:hypothetical protein B0J13DRAFT_532581 [Dactylonectria estremocensis]|uniref:Uncharacterized protein n=1 Tax=Dactylonectria estremocensis TaxID=1079267 RepID=A0A9P9DHV3_9HYPO|nr:hypothetical protein B0J13DRAFT_532581 [Dactylonectria estremocensis]
MYSELSNSGGDAVTLISIDTSPGHILSILRSIWPSEKPGFMSFDEDPAAIELCEALVHINVQSSNDEKQNVLRILRELWPFINPDGLSFDQDPVTIAFHQTLYGLHHVHEESDNLCTSVFHTIYPSQHAEREDSQHLYVPLLWDQVYEGNTEIYLRHEWLEVFQGCEEYSRSDDLMDSVPSFTDDSDIEELMDSVPDLLFADEMDFEDFEE